MDNKENLTNNRAEENSATQSRLSESNTTHISVQTTSPFLNKLKGAKYTTRGNIIDRNIETRDVFNKKTTREAYSTISKVLINESSLEQNLYDEEQPKTNGNEDRGEKSKFTNKHLIVNNAEFTHYTQSFNDNAQFDNVEIDTKKLLTYLLNQNKETFKRNDKITKVDSFIINNEKISQSSMSDEKYKEKSTYCRPVHNFYSQESIYKTMQRNTRLQRIVRKLAIARQKEKQTEAWNNYINDLKNKHLHDNDHHKIILQNNSQAPDCSNIINDYYSTKHGRAQSYMCRNLRDFYGESNTLLTNYSNKYPLSRYKNDTTISPSHYSQYLYENHSDCYPISSQSRLMMLNKEKQRSQFANQWENCPANRRYYRNTIVVDPNINNNSKKIKISRSKSSSIPQNQLNSLLKSLSIQTDISVLPFSQELEHKGIHIIEKKETLKDKYNTVAENVERLKKKIYGSQIQQKYDSLTSIENKLDTLIKSINCFINEVKAKNVLEQGNKISTSVSCKSSSIINKINISESDPRGFRKAEQIICGMVTDTSRSNIATSEFDSSCGRHAPSKFDKIIIEEMDKTDRVKKDIEDILNGQTHRPRAVQISFDVPTKERSTEVTKSLSKTKFEKVEKEIIDEVSKIPSRNESRMTIAVNTDPLGLLALLRVSRETVRQLLSYMPNIPYHSYLSMMMTPQVQMNRISHFECNICGAAFGRSSQLSDHIRNHNLGEIRDCCVCRHILDTQRRSPSGLFACQYCGQRFTRAYCCDLHQQSCARILGKPHDVNSSLMLLR